VTYETLHLMTQVVGKVRLGLTPWLNHSWHCPLYVTARGLATGVIHGEGGPLDVEFDLIGGALRLRTDRQISELPLGPTSIADFYARVRRALAVLDVPVRLHATPNELPEAVPFEKDVTVRAYDPEQALLLFRALARADQALRLFRTGFVGKASPSHFFWGGFDLAVTRFSGRKAPPHPGGIPNLPDEVTREAYSHEVSSAGFWPGGAGCEEAVFYSYAYPEPPGFAAARVAPQAARYDTSFGEFMLPYVAVAEAADPEALVLAFLQSTYEAAADLGRWDRSALECDLGAPGLPRKV
jgi:hypothetical protein